MDKLKEDADIKQIIKSINELIDYITEEKQRKIQEEIQRFRNEKEIIEAKQISGENWRRLEQILYGYSVE